MAKATTSRSTPAKSKPAKPEPTGSIRVGVGGWTFEPWRGAFYPQGLAHKRELEFASRALTSIEINGTYYSTFKPDSWRKWRDETPDDFVFAVKASRYCTNRKILGSAGEAIDRFVGQGLTELDGKHPAKAAGADRMSACAGGSSDQAACLAACCSRAAFQFHGSSSARRCAG